MSVISLDFEQNCIDEFREKFCYERDNTLSLTGLRTTGMTAGEFEIKLEKFWLSKLKLQRERDFKEFGEIILEKENILDHHEKYYPGCPRCIEITANNYYREQILSALNKKG